MNSSSYTNSIFEEPWWLDATAPGQWDAVEITNNGDAIARLPFVIKRKLGLTLLTQPSLTQTLGPWTKATNGKYHSELSTKMQLYQELIELLPKHDIFSQNFHTNITNWLPFYWSGYSQSTNYSYTIDLKQDADHIFADFSTRARRSIRKAEKVVEVTESDSIEELLEVNRKTFQRQGLTVPYSDRFVYSIDEATAKHANRLILIAKDASGKVHGGSYYVGDTRRMYLLINGGDPALRNSGAGTLLVWEAIQRLKGNTEIFDFEGSMIPGVEKFYRGFGAKQTPYFNIKRSLTNRGRIALGIRNYK